MKLMWAIFADAANMSAEGKVNALGIGIDRIYAGEVPTTAPPIVLRVKLRTQLIEPAMSI